MRECLRKRKCRPNVSGGFCLFSHLPIRAVVERGKTGEKRKLLGGIIYIMTAQSISIVISRVVIRKAIHAACITGAIERDMVMARIYHGPTAERIIRPDPRFPHHE